MSLTSVLGVQIGLCLEAMGRLSTNMSLSSMLGGGFGFHPRS